MQWIDSTGTVHLDFAAAERKARGMTDAALLWAARDAAAAADANPSGRKAGYYLDEAATYRRELARRGY